MYVRTPLHKTQMCTNGQNSDLHDVNQKRTVETVRLHFCLASHTEWLHCIRHE